MSPSRGSTIGIREPISAYTNRTGSGSTCLRRRRNRRPRLSRRQRLDRKPGEMLSYIVHRILIMIPTLIAISIVIFTIINLPPGNYFTTYVAELESSGEATDLAKVKFLEHEYGFDQPLWRQYLHWAGGLLHGDMGYSFSYDLPVNKVVGDRMLLT